jgi:hypothetical protein
MRVKLVGFGEEGVGGGSVSIVCWCGDPSLFGIGVQEEQIWVVAMPT